MKVDVNVVVSSWSCQHDVISRLMQRRCRKTSIVSSSHQIMTQLGDLEWTPKTSLQKDCTASMQRYTSGRTGPKKINYLKVKMINSSLYCAALGQLQEGPQVYRERLKQDRKKPLYFVMVNSSKLIVGVDNFFRPVHCVMS